jgi:hypothetical protein
MVVAYYKALFQSFSDGLSKSRIKHLICIFGASRHPAFCPQSTSYTCRVNLLGGTGNTNTEISDDDIEGNGDKK